VLELAGLIGPSILEALEAWGLSPYGLGSIATSRQGYTSMSSNRINFVSYRRKINLIAKAVDSEQQTILFI